METPNEIKFDEEYYLKIIGKYSVYIEYLNSIITNLKEEIDSLKKDKNNDKK